MTPVPAVTVLIGVLDNERTIGRAIESILGQSLTDLELIVIDDGSSDASAEAARRAIAGDRRGRVLSLEENVGIARSLNLGLQEAAAPVVAIQDADDWSEPERLERQVAALADDPDVAVVGCRMREFDRALRPVRSRTRFAVGDVGDVLLRFNPIPNGCAAFRRHPVRAVGGYDRRFKYAAEYDLWLRLAERHRILALDIVLCNRVMSGTNVSAYAERALIRESIAIRLAALRRRRSLRGVGSLARAGVSWLAPLPWKRALRRSRGQAP